MASLRYETDRTRKGWRLQFYTADKKKRSLWLGDISKRASNNVKRHVEELLRAKKANSTPDADSEKWANEITGPIRDALVRIDLAEPVDVRLSLDSSKFLGPFIDDYINHRTDVKSRTKSNFLQAKRWAIKFFGSDRHLRLITSGDIEKWIRFMERHSLSDATIRTHVKRLRAMLHFAIRSRLIETNPAISQKLGSDVNSSRQFFISHKLTDAILKACPDHDWRLIFALPRFAGLRCPTEVLELRWTDVNCEQGRLRIDSVKTGLRMCPIFPELRPLLADAFDAAPDGSEFVVQRYRGGDANLGTQMKRIIKRAGYEPWEKTFVNLRSTRRTELEELFPSHVVNGWLGHSAQVAEKHYLQITSDHWQRAADLVDSNSIGGDILDDSRSTGGDVPAPAESQGFASDQESEGNFELATSTCDSTILNQYPGVGSNHQPSASEADALSN